jgi:hypothetical protein
MRKIVVAAAFVALVILSTLAFRKSPAPEIVPDSPTASVSKKLPTPNAEERKTAPIPVPPKIALSDISQECRALWEDLQSRDFSEPPTDLKNGTDCQAPKLLAMFHRDYLEQCGFKPIPTKSKRAVVKPTAESCVASAIQYRLRANDFLTQNQPLAEITDLDLLKDKLVSQSEQNPVRAAEVAERLLTLDSNNIEAAKASFMGRFVDFQTNPKDPEKMKNAERALEVLKRQPDSGTAEIAEMEMTLLVFKGKENGREKFLSLAADTAQKFPQSGIGPYNQAVGAFLDQNKEQSILHLKEAIRREPHNIRYLESLRLYPSGFVWGASYRMADKKK